MKAQYKVLTTVKCGIPSECEKPRWASGTHHSAEIRKLKWDRNAWVEALIHKVRERVLMRQREKEMRHMAADKESWSWGKVACLDRARHESLYRKWRQNRAVLQAIVSYEEE
jgi:hypothetical protein